jgi:hypothetical protein
MGRSYLSHRVSAMRSRALLLTADRLRRQQAVER